MAAAAAAVGPVDDTTSRGAAGYFNWTLSSREQALSQRLPRDSSIGIGSANLTL